MPDACTCFRFKSQFTKFFPNKTDDDFARLDQAADALVVRGDGFINHAAMFAENALGTQNDFIEEIRDQHVELSEMLVSS